MIFQILCPLSHSHTFRLVVFDWQAFEFEPILIVITTSTELQRQLTVFSAGCAILCSEPEQQETADLR